MSGYLRNRFQLLRQPFIPVLLASELITSALFSVQLFLSLFTYCQSTTEIDTCDPMHADIAVVQTNSYSRGQ